MYLIYMDFFSLLPFRDTLFLSFLASMALSYSPIRNKNDESLAWRYSTMKKLALSTLSLALLAPLALLTLNRA